MFLCIWPANLFLQDLIMIVIVKIAIGRCRSDSVRRRSWLGFAGILLVAAAGLAAYGLKSALGTRAG